MGGIGDVLDPAGVFHDPDVSSEGGRALNTIFDPLDLFGNRAEATQEEMGDIIMQAAREAFESAEGRYEDIKRLQEPFLEYGEEGLEQEYPQEFSERYERDLQEGSNALNRSLAARGLSKSSYAGEQLSDLGLGLTEQELARQHQNKLNKLKIGQMAAGTAGRGGAQFAGSTGDIAAQKGAGIQNAMNAFGNQRAASMQGAGNLFQNLGMWLDDGGA